MELKEGFKHTEIGIIPKDWKIENLSTLSNQIIDGTHYTPIYTDKGVPFLRVTDLQNNDIDFNKVKYISEEEHRFLIKRCYPQINDLLLSKNGTIGIPKVIDWDWEFSVFVSLALIKIKHNCIDSVFLKEIFESNIIDNQIREQSKQGTVTNLHLEEIRKFLIPLPPLPEQQKIAQALNDTDDLILSLQKLIEKKKAIKQGAMQELLKPKEDWETKKLGEIAFIKTGSKNNQDKDESGQYPFFVRSQTVEKINNYNYP